MKRKGQPCKAQGEELFLKKTALGTGIILFQGVVKDLGALIPGCRDERTIPNTIPLTII